MKVMLEYTYIFDPNEAWTSFSQFDEAMAKMLDGMGLQAQVIRCVGDEDKKVVEITKKPELVGEPSNIRSIKQQKYSVMQKKGYDGKFVKIT